MNHVLGLTLESLVCLFHGTCCIDSCQAMTFFSALYYVELIGVDFHFFMMLSLKRFRRSLSARKRYFAIGIENICSQETRILTEIDFVNLKY